MARKALTKIKVGKLERGFSFAKNAVNSENRTVALAFSSEAPYERWFGNEVLGHGSGECDLQRLNSGTHPLLLDHDSRQQIGVIEKAEIDADKKGRAVVRFTPKGINAQADQVFAEIEAGIRSLVSVGYSINQIRLEECEGDDPEDDDCTYRVTSWTPMEISMVSIPADPTVGIGRANENESRELSVIIPEKFMKRSILFKADPIDGGDKPAFDAAPAILEAKNSEIARVREIVAMGTKHRFVGEANEAVEKGTSADEFRKLVVDKLHERGSKKEEISAGTAGDEFYARRIGDELVKAKEYTSRINPGQKGQPRNISLTIDAPLNYRATLTGTVSGLTSYQRPPGLILLGQQELLVAELFAPGVTESLTVRYMQEDTFTNGAANLAEEGTYAESSFDLSEQDSAVKKIGVLSRITDEQLEDSAMVGSYFNERTPFMVMQKEDQYLITGTGNTSQLKGILNTTGILTTSAAAGVVADAFHKAKTKVRSTGFFQPDFYVINPFDFENIKLTKDNNGQYHGGGPFYSPYGNTGYSNVENLWGLPAVLTTAMTRGTALCGAFRLGGQLWRRRGINVQMTNSDASDFANGRVAIRADVRDALAIYRPAAFCSITGIPIV